MKYKPNNTYNPLIWMSGVTAKVKAKFRRKIMWEEAVLWLAVIMPASNACKMKQVKLMTINPLLQYTQIRHNQFQLWEAINECKIMIKQ